MNLPFTGHFVNAVDAKGRVSVPSDFREQAATRCRRMAEPGETSIKENELRMEIHPSFNRIRVYDVIGIRQLAAKLEAGISGIDAAEQDEVLSAKGSSRFGGMTVTTFDNVGRLVLPPHLREFAEIGDYAVFWGSTYFFEIFSPQHATTHFANDIPNARLLAWDLKQKGIRL